MTGCDESVTRGDEEFPPEHLGDDPGGWYWSAERPPEASADEPLDHSVHGSVIRLMWDYGVRVPLWDAEGLLPEDPQWLRESLGLSEALIEDLTRWGGDMNELDATPSHRTKEACDALDARARALSQRLQQEVGSRYTVTYRPW